MVNENLKIEIRPIPNRNNIRNFSEKLEYYSQAHIICPYVDPVSLRYQTGLSNEDKQYLLDKGFPYDISDIYKRGEAHPFWESNLVKVELRNTPMFLYPGKSLMDFVKYKFLLASNFVYVSEEEMQAGTKPQATHFIYNEDIENATKATRLEKRNNLIQSVSKLSLERKRNIVLIINDENTDTKNEDYLTIKLEEIIGNYKKRPLLEELLAKSKGEVEVMSMIKRATRKNVLRKTSKGYFYFDVNLGLTMEDVMTYLNKAENQEVLLTIKDKL